MSIKTINSYVYNFATWSVVIGYGLKSLIKYLPIDIRQWLADIPSPLVQFWVICFTLVFLTGGVYLVLAFRTVGITKKFWNVLSSIAILFIFVVSIAYMTTDTLNNFRATYNLPFFDYRLPEYESIEGVMSSDKIQPKIKAEINQYYAQYVYTHEGKIIDVFDEVGQKSKFEPSSEDIKEWEKVNAIFKQGENLSNSFINRTIYSLAALVLGLFIGLILPTNRITKRSTRTQ